jgi:hypothetical protein
MERYFSMRLALGDKERQRGQRVTDMIGFRKLANESQAASVRQEEDRRRGVK